MLPYGMSKNYWFDRNDLNINALPVVGKQNSSEDVLNILVWTLLTVVRKHEKPSSDKGFYELGSKFKNIYCEGNRLLTVIVCKLCPWQSEEAVCRGDFLPHEKEKHHLQSIKVVNYLWVFLDCSKSLPVWGRLLSIYFYVCILKKPQGNAGTSAGECFHSSFSTILP